MTDRKLIERAKKSRKEGGQRTEGPWSNLLLAPSQMDRLLALAERGIATDAFIENARLAGVRLGLDAAAKEAHIQATRHSRRWDRGQRMSDMNKSSTANAILLAIRALSPAEIDGAGK